MIAISFFKWLDHLDKVLVVLIQHDSDQHLLDEVMVLLRNPYSWIPLYLFLLYFILRKDRKEALLFIGLSLLTFAITDSVTTQVLKPLIGRLRPCHDPELHGFLRGLIDCGGIYSMPSSHAANHFGLAAFWYYSLLLIRRKDAGQQAARHGSWYKCLWIWAAVVCYAQIYVGKHYPSDILAGALFGYLTGTGAARLFRYLWNRRYPKKTMDDQSRYSMGNLVA